MSHRQIPTIDLSLAKTDFAAFADALGKGFREFGFVGIAQHGLSDTVVEEAYRVSRAFFALPADTKKKYFLEGKGGARGYTPFKTEQAVGAKLPDLKEFYHIGRDLPPGHKMAKEWDANLPVAEVADFLPNMRALFAALDGLGDTVLRGIAQHLGESPDFFAKKTDYGSSILRPIHYPPIADLDSAAERAGAHTDINLITLLVGSHEAGLEVKSRTGEWIAVTTIPGTIVCNIGDMLQRFTNHVLPSTEHKVVNPPGMGRTKPRYSIPYFMHLNPDCWIKTMKNCISAENPNRYPEPILADEYLKQRLFDIKLIKTAPVITPYPGDKEAA